MGCMVLIGIRAKLQVQAADPSIFNNKSEIKHHVYTKLLLPSM